VTLQMELTTATDLSVGIFGLNGQYFGEQITEKSVAGEQSFTLNTSNLPIGFYLVRIQAGNAVKTEKMIVVR
ncbi:MAG: T9SS type A sorting domain-containing protein, partial [Saprospiraceae bacterium]|nr:T9SS type A sorting domain-containing protein [Saprospiraceae bacterium]